MSEFRLRPSYFAFLLSARITILAHVRLFDVNKLSAIIRFDIDSSTLMATVVSILNFFFSCCRIHLIPLAHEIIDF